MLPGPLPRLKRFPKLWQWLMQLYEHVVSITPVASHNVRVYRTARGTSYVGTAKGEEADRSPGWYQGEYDATREYFEGDGVTISGGGASSGTYIALRDVPIGQAPSYPDVGVYWRIIGRTSDVSFFT